MVVFGVQRAGLVREAKGTRDGLVIQQEREKVVEREGRRRSYVGCSPRATLTLFRIGLLGSRSAIEMTVEQWGQ